ncbi:major facilitator superfamily transporter [Colletotrichum scovillei]|uniref:Major facilitator superfamily transporter n=2 Tax=Colletotrichum scovillei TaxID=1209932 RepID=A0A9P7RCE1_9PEZI|nr:major facilitator superfamily transporter [Colletotrichum scovillei]KAG7074013.1 major facilitator superfamily transporter [Colletotrichum scovillei]KAG7081168.1 major facilitator superfamily transporter [Colletotrichum scovillei]
MPNMNEEQPLLVEDPICEEDISKHLLDFDPNGDPENPREWPAPFKWTLVALLALTAFTVTFTCISVVPVAAHIIQDLDQNEGANSPASALLVTIWELGEAAGPLLIAPLSEIYGRYPVMNAANILFIIATVLAAISTSTPLLIGARCLTGLAVASNVLNPAIIGDMFVPDNRGSAMSIVSLAPLIGGAVGPMISGAIAQTLGWRQVLWMSAGLATVCEILFLTCFRETYKMTILRRRAAKHAEEHGAPLHPAGVDDHKSLIKLWESIKRPFYVLLRSNVLMGLSFFGCITFAYFYVMSISLPVILHDVYGFSPTLTGLSFMSFSIGSFISVIVSNFSLDRIYVKLRGNDPVGRPEYRLPLVIIGAFTLPLSITAYGWIAELRLPVGLLLLSVAMLGFTLLMASLPLSAYVVDATGLYSASAMTGVIVTRCLAGTFLPLASGPMVQSFGYGWGFTMLGAFSICLAPIPVVIMRYGHAWRQKSEYTRDA